MILLPLLQKHGTMSRNTGNVFQYLHNSFEQEISSQFPILAVIFYAMNEFISFFLRLYDKLCDSSNDKCSGAGQCPKIYKMMSGYRVGRFERRQENGNRRRMEDIMYEVKSQGPVLAIMEIHRDFFSYRNGIYHKINLGKYKKSIVLFH